MSFMLGKSGFYLINYEHSVGIGNVNFLNKENTIEEYINWENKTHQYISLTDEKIMPQIKKNTSIREFTHFSYFIKYAMTYCELTEEDISLPLGLGIKNFNFRNLLNRLWDFNYSDDFYDYENEIKNYFIEIFKELKEEEV